MPRIPILDQNVGVANASMPRIQAPQASNEIGAGLQKMGQGGMDLAQGLQAQEIIEKRVLKHQEEQDGAVYAGQALSDAHLKWSQQMQTMKEQAKPGAPDFTPTLVKQYDDWQKGAIEQAPTPSAKRFLTTHLQSLRTSLATQALGFEAGARQDYRVSTQLDSIQKASNVVLDNPTPENFKQRYAEQKAVIDALDVPPDKRSDLNNKLRDSMLTGYWIGRIRVDPSAAAVDLKNGFVPDQGAGGGSAFDKAVGFTLRAEGGLNAADTNGTPSNMGINQAAHPGVDVKNLTKSQAIAIYKKDYWDFVGGDELSKTNPGLAMAAFDTAALNKVKAKQFLDQSGGDVNKFMDLRENFLASLLKSDPDKYGKYANAWATRNKELRAQIGGLSGGQPFTMNATPSENVKPSGDSILDATPLQIRLQMIQHADAEQNRQQAVFRSSLSTTEGDHIAMYMNGATVPKPLTAQDYTKAYGPIEGPQRFENYRQIAALGGDISTLKMATPEQMAATVDKYKPDESKPGYELALKRYDTMLKAADQVNQARQADPMQFAQQAKIGDAKPLSFADQAAFGAELAKRAGVASTMQQTYGTPFRLLTGPEAQTMTKAFDTMTTQQKVGYLSTIKRFVTDPAAYRAVMQQIAPDSPVLAMAGTILAKQRPVVVSASMPWNDDTVYTQQNVASLMLEGEALLNPTKAAKGEDGKGKSMPMPKEDDFRSQFTNVTGKAFAADPNGANFAMQAVKAYYAGKSARDGDFSGDLNSGRLKEAITAVIGGVTDVNGKGEVVRPWGMDEARFKNGVNAAFSQAMEKAGYKGTQFDVFGAYGLQASGDSKYMLRSGTGYLTDRQGQPIVLDLSEAPGQQINGGKGYTGFVPPEPLQPPATQVQPKTAKPNLQEPKTK